MNDDHVRPIPQGSRQEPAADDVYVVDTRPGGRTRRDRSTPAATAPAPPPERRAARPVAHGTPGDAVPPAPAVATAYDELGRPVASAAPGGPGGPGRPAAPRPARAPRRPAGGRRWLRAMIALLVGWLAFVVLTPVHAWSQVTREDTTPTGDRPADADGSTYLLVGSDSREGLTAKEREALGIGGNAKGRRTDSIILVHTPGGSGKPVLISIPRDSYLPIPGERDNKVNAAFALGGPKLLVATLEQATGLPIDGYVEIGLGGFAGVVDSLGGVEVCVKRDIQDDKADIDLRAGCQVLDGKNSLGYVRARYSDPRGDLGRAERQRQFLGAVMKQAATPSTVLIPWRWWNFTHTATSSVVVGEDTSLLDSSRILSTMRKVSSDQALSLVVPLASTNATTSAGSSVIWDDDRAESLFSMLRDGVPIDAPPPGTDGTPSSG